MNEELFWEIIEESRTGLKTSDIDGNMEVQSENLREKLESLTKGELEDFYKISHELNIKAYRWDLWGAAYVIGGGCSDDSFMDFRSWLISMGKEVYYLGINSPDDLVGPATDPTVEDCFYEGFLYAIDEVYEEKFGQEIVLEIKYPSNPEGKDWDEDDLEKLFPKLSAKFD
ncbi:DUF4240 domain-containing protein [Aurantivibrio infirmus]